MDSKSQRERLEQELRFLKESFEAEVISKEEFEKGKERIERKLSEIDYLHSSDIEAKIEPEKKELAEKENKKDEEQVKESKEPKHETHEKPSSDQIESHDEKEEQIHHKQSDHKEKSEDHLLKYAIIFVLVVGLIGLSIFLLRKANVRSEPHSEVTILCVSNEDCVMEGMSAKCINPGLANSTCEFTPLKRLNVIVLVDRENCISCDTSRIIGILSSWFGPINATEINYNSVRGKDLASKYSASMLPFFIIEKSVGERAQFNEHKNSLLSKDDAYVLSENVAAASVYINRPIIQKKVDFFVIEGDATSQKAERNLKEFLDNFDVEFEKHTSTSALARELGLRTFPAFMVNNKAKFTGVHTADSIKENYCKLNEDDKCNKTLSKNLVN